MREQVGHELSLLLTRREAEYLAITGNCDDKKYLSGALYFGNDNCYSRRRFIVL